MDKTCLVCGRIINPRQKWEKNWDQIKYCSEKCRRNKKPPDYSKELLQLLNQRGKDKTICPSEVLAEDEKQNHEKMEAVRSCARRMVAQGLIVITQKGQIVDPSTAKGPIRLKLKS